MLFLIQLAYVAADSSSSTIVTTSFVNQIPYPARTGDIVELRYKIENYGSTNVNDITYQLAVQYPFLEVPGEQYTITIPTLSAYQNQDNALIIKFKVRIANDVKESVKNIDLKEIQSPGNAAVHSFPITISTSAFAQIIFVDKAKIDPGQETPVKFTINNIGNSPIDNIIFSWTETNNVILPIYSDNTKYIKHLDAGQSADLDYTIIADTNAQQGLYQLTLNLKFDTINGTQTIQTKAGMFVGGETDFDVAFSESSLGQTSISIANIGNNPAYSVTVSIPLQSNYRVSGSQSSIIGNLDKGDYTIASFQLTSASTIGANRTQIPASFNQTRGARGQFPSANASAGNTLVVQIDYTDTTGERHTVLKNVPIQFRDSTTSATNSQTTGVSRQRTNFWTSPIAIIGGILIIIVIIAGVVVIRRRNNAKNQLLKRKKE